MTVDLRHSLKNLDGVAASSSWSWTRVIASNDGAVNFENTTHPWRYPAHSYPGEYRSGPIDEDASWPEKSIPTLQTGQPFNEAPSNSGRPPRPRYKFIRRLRAPSCNVIVVIQPDGAETSCKAQGKVDDRTTQRLLDVGSLLTAPA